MNHVRKSAPSTGYLLDLRSQNMLYRVIRDGQVIDMRLIRD